MCVLAPCVQLQLLPVALARKLCDRHATLLLLLSVLQ